MKLEIKLILVKCEEENDKYEGKYLSEIHKYKLKMKHLRYNLRISDKINHDKISTSRIKECNTNCTINSQ